MTEEWQERLEYERCELSDRLTKLQSYLHNKIDGKFIPIESGVDICLLNDQLSIIKQYLIVLEKRIERFE